MAQNDQLTAFPENLAVLKAPKSDGAPVRESLFVSANAWDPAGICSFGFATFWSNRSAQPAEALGITPSATGTQLTDALNLVR